MRIGAVLWAFPVLLRLTAMLGRNVRLLVRLSALLFIVHLTRLENSGMPRQLNTASPLDSSPQWADRLKDGSSAFCDGSSVSTRTCRFENLCYFFEHDEFVLLHGAQSLFSGLPGDRHSAFLDMSSVSDHNTQRFEFVDLPALALFNESGHLRQPVTYHHGLSLIFKRFNPGNLMHVIHDDLLPVYLTQLKHRVSGNEPLQLIAVDSHPQSPFKQLYDALSRKPLILKAELSESRVTCFQSAIVGLPKETTWYQYGFSNHQGPINNTLADGKLIRQFASSIRRALGVIDSHSDLPKPAVLLSRSMNRVILNEEQLVNSLQQELNCTVDVVSIETAKLEDLIGRVSHADILIGMHGGSMALAVFLPPNSAVVELFPYAVPADAYTPYKTLASLPSMSISYGSWENKWQENTVTHPEYPTIFGGISHLSVSEQEHIMKSSQVQAHVCCSNPEWLFRIYQDTRLDMPSIMKVVRAAWNK